MATHSSVLAWRIPDGGAWWAAVYGVAQSWTQLNRLSSSSSRMSYNSFICYFIELKLQRFGVLEQLYKSPLLTLAE